MKKMKIAVAQVDAAVGNLQKNIAHHVAYTKKAIAKGASLIVFPELSLTGYSVKDLNWDVAIKVGSSSPFKELLKLSRAITIIAGGVEEGENFGLYNSAFVFEDEELYSGHRKIYPPTYGMFEEMRYFSPGKEVRAFRSRLGSLGILICEDLWHLSLPYILASEGAEVIIALAASPTRMSGSSKELPTAAINREHHKSYARLLSSYIVFANRVGFEDGVNFWGGSEVVDPSGEVIASAKLFDEEMIFADVDENAVRRARRLSRHFVDDSLEFTLGQLRRVKLGSDGKRR
ncbi:MAG TPA: nitrilase-related carbon-nitrogen hydrolase [Bacteroidota bacterium]|nr:nitrilase-related carbon-nitrogen hydrolase [Bacteroidota bacterium]